MGEGETWQSQAFILRVWGSWTDLTAKFIPILFLLVLLSGYPIIHLFTGALGLRPVGPVRGHTWSVSLRNMQTGEGRHKNTDLQTEHAVCCTQSPSPENGSLTPVLRALLLTQPFLFFRHGLIMYPCQDQHTTVPNIHVLTTHFSECSPVVKQHMTACHCLVTYCLVDGRVGSLLFLLCACMCAFLSVMYPGVLVDRRL